jgi:hypothetical protein
MIPMAAGEPQVGPVSFATDLLGSFDTVQSRVGSWGKCYTKCPDR